MEEKFNSVCAGIGSMATIRRNAEELASLRKNLEGGSVVLDNLLYEALGVSGEEVICLLQNGERMV